MSKSDKPINGAGARIRKELFSTERIHLIREVKQHPPLLELLAEAQYEPDDWGGIIGEIAAYCNVMMDGVYAPSEIDHLCGQLIFKLRGMRTLDAGVGSSIIIH